MVAGADGTVTVCPGRTSSRPGDVVTTVGPARRQAEREPAVRDRRARTVAVIRSVLRSDRALVFTVSGLLALVAVATLVLRLAYHGPGAA